MTSTTIQGGLPFHQSHQPTALGESPLYRPSDSTLHWVDFFSSPPSLHILSTIDKSSYRIIGLPERVTCIYFRAAHPHSYIVAYSHGIGFLNVNPDPKDSSASLRVVKELWGRAETGMTMNDGGVDPAGRFWCTAVDLDGLAANGGAGQLPKSGGRGCLWRYDGKEVKVMEEGVSVGNGIAWSVDGKTSEYSSFVRTMTSRCIDAGISVLQRLWCPKNVGIRL
jgi:sugar lactone lactonase YvrE